MVKGNSDMEICVRLSSDLVQHVGKTRLSMQLSDDATVADLMSHLRTEHPSLTDRLEMAVPMKRQDDEAVWLKARDPR